MKTGFEVEEINALKNLRIAVIGDAMLDRYVTGEVKRTSPEAPVPVLKVKSEEYILGGACNVAANIASMGAKPVFFSVIGDDQRAEILSDLLKKNGIAEGCIVREKIRPTILKTRMMAMGQQLIRIDEEEILPISEKSENTILKKFVASVKKFAGVIISDYNKGVLSESLIQKIINICKDHKIKVIGDPKGTDYKKYRHIFTITPNALEAEIASGVGISNEPTLEKAGRKLMDIIKSDALIITRGAEGVTVFDGKKPAVYHKARAREVYDVSGAGDTFISLFGMGLFSGMDVDRAAELGNYAASLVVEKVGVAVISPEELMEFISGETIKTKFVNLPQIEKILKALRKKQKKIVFTNGCFDLIHVGHIKFLQNARELGDCLIVALNTDESVRRIKGKPRPIISEIDRIHLISAIEGVDYVMLFNEDEPVNLIKSLKPDFLVKGKNISDDEVVGKKIVEQYGGKVVRLPFYHGMSTNAMIDDIAKNYKEKK